MFKLKNLAVVALASSLAGGCAGRSYRSDLGANEVVPYFKDDKAASSYIKQCNNFNTLFEIVSQNVEERPTIASLALRKLQQQEQFQAFRLAQSITLKAESKNEIANTATEFCIKTALHWNTSQSDRELAIFAIADRITRLAILDGKDGSKGASLSPLATYTSELADIDPDATARLVTSILSNDIVPARTKLIVYLWSGVTDNRLLSILLATIITAENSKMYSQNMAPDNRFQYETLACNFRNAIRGRY